MKSEATLKVNALELAFLVHVTWEPAKMGDVVARGLFEKVKAASITLGVPWVYGDPWRDAH